MLFFPAIIVEDGNDSKLLLCLNDEMCVKGGYTLFN